MLQKLLRRSKLHDCDHEQRFDVSRNRAVVHFGVVWQCPDCKAFWYRQIEYIDRFRLLYEGRAYGRHSTEWRRLSKRQVRQLRQLSKQGIGQLEIAERMNFEPPRHASAPFDPRWEDDIEKHNQNPKDWVFSWR